MISLKIYSIISRFSACQLLTFVALVEYAVVNVRLREDAERAKREKEERENNIEQENQDETERLDEMTLWLMGMFL